MGNLSKKLLEIQKSVRAFSKDAKAFNYTYVEGSKILNVIRPKMDELGLLLINEITRFESSPVTYQAWDSKAGSVLEKTEILSTIDCLFTWVDTETDETMPVRWAGSGMNGFDKSLGSAMTYAERYFLLKFFHVATDRDDVDAVSIERDEAIEKAKEKAVKVTSPKKEKKTIPAAEPKKPAEKPAMTEPGKRRITLADKDFFAEVLSWTLRQKDTEKAIQKATDNYDWDIDALVKYRDEARSAAAFKKELSNGN